jgi:hypothetical protein
MDVKTIAILAVVVASVAVIVFVWDQRSRRGYVEWADAGKVAIGAGGIAGGVAYAVGTDAVLDVVESATTAAQDMFVGKPEF